MLLQRHGGGAELHAARRADGLAEAGDEAGCRAWKQILAALDELRRTRPRAGGARHRRGFGVSRPWPTSAGLAPGGASLPVVRHPVAPRTLGGPARGGKRRETGFVGESAGAAA